MNERGKSDGCVVPAKPTNTAAVAAAESVEERRPAEGNMASKTRPGHSAGSGALSALDRVREVARKDKEARFTALLHHVDVARLRAAFWAIRPQAAPGVDGVTWDAYGQELEANLQDLHERVHAGRYRARPSRSRHRCRSCPEPRRRAASLRRSRTGPRSSSPPASRARHPHRRPVPASPGRRRRPPASPPSSPDLSR